MVDWTTIIVAVIGAGIAAIAPTIVALRTHREVNSRMTELLHRTRESSHAAGVEDERLRDKSEDD